jgi:hypothetical protein
MVGRWRRRSARSSEVAFCDECGQVCTSTCQAQARLDRIRTEIALQVPLR